MKITVEPPEDDQTTISFKDVPLLRAYLYVGFNGKDRCLKTSGVSSLREDGVVLSPSLETRVYLLPEGTKFTIIT